MGWLETLKEAWGAAEKLHDAKLNNLLGKAMMEGAELAQENASLRDENHTLKEQARLRARMEYRDNVYWKHEEGPCCPKCWPADSKAVMMTQQHSGWRCPVCKTYIMKSRFGQEQPEDFEPPREPIR